MHMHSGLVIFSLGLLVTCGSAVQATDTASSGDPQAPKVERVVPLDKDPSLSAPGVFSAENLEHITDLRQSFQDQGLSQGRFGLSRADAFSGTAAIQQTYLPKEEMKGDPGDAGWVWRFFGDNPHLGTQEPNRYRTVVARWYHKFEEGFTPREGEFPPKMARMRCFQGNDWNAAYTVLFWFEDKDGHLSIERATRAPGAHREWLPNHYANFLLSDPANIGRWICFELRVSLGDGPRSDRIQAWADGRLVCDIIGDDLAAGNQDLNLNGMSWDCYWNGGSPREESRYYDDLVLSTEPVGPARTGLNPTIVKSAFRGGKAGDRQQGWEIEVAKGVQQPMVPAQTEDGVVTRYQPLKMVYTMVWKGAVAGEQNEVTVDDHAGTFAGPCQGKTHLEANTLHFVRVRQQDTAGRWSPWSSWQAGFATDWAAGTPAAKRTPPRGYSLTASVEQR
jgi:hypothetical protein